MASDGKDSVTSKVGNENKAVKINEELDLEKKPINYADHDGSLTKDAHDKDYMELMLRSGKHSDFVKKMVRQRIELRAKEFPRWPATSTGGTRLMWIESRFWYDRERLLPDFDSEWRSYRAKYLQSLELDPREPVHVPEYERMLLNPIRRFYMKGGDFLEEKIIRRFEKNRVESAVYRVVATRALMGYVMCLGFYYWIRYGHNKWYDKYGPIVTRSALVVYPGHPKFPLPAERTEPAHHWDLGFSRRKGFYDDLRDWEDTTVVL